MKLNGLLWENIKKSQHDYFIYSISLFFQHALLYSANLLGNSVFAQNVGSDVSNSLPLIIVITMICFGMYINRFMIRQRSKEFATYMLVGLTKQDIVKLYGIETLIMEFVGLVIGSLAGYLFVLIYGYSIGDRIFINMDIQVLGRSFLLTVFYSGVIFLIVYLYSSRVINKTTLRQLMYRKFYNEKPYKTGKLCDMVLAICFVIFITQLFFIDIPAISGTLFPVLVVLLVTGQLFIWKRILKIRESDSILYKNKGQLFRVGILMSKQRSQVKLSVVLSLCFILSFICYILGSVFMNAREVLMDQELDYFMGVAQSYFSIIFLVAIIGITGIKQITETMEQQKSIIILRNQGMGNREIKHNLLKLSAQSYLIPLIMGITISTITFLMFYCQSLLDSWMKVEVLKGGIQFVGIFVLILACFILGTYVGYVHFIERGKQ